MGPHDFHGGDAAFPIFGSVMMLILVLALGAAYLLWRQGKLVLPDFGRRSVEDGAKRILAERFAHGQISSEEFMERASILNWTPGAEAYPAVRRKRRRS